MLPFWPESERLQIALSSSSPTKNHQPTLPFVKYEFATNFIHGVNFSMDQEGLLALIESGAFRDALFMTTKLLSNIGQGIGGGSGVLTLRAQISPSSLQIWSTRFQLMLALRYHSQLLEELAAFGELDAPDLYFQFHPEYSGTKGSLVPFSLRLVHAEAASFSPTNPYLSIARIKRLERDTGRVIEMVRQQSDNAADSQAELIWRQRLENVKQLHAIILFRLKEFDKSFSEFERILLAADSPGRRAHLLGAVLRMAMQIGDVPRVERYLVELGALRGTAEGEEEEDGIRQLIDMHSCFKSIFDGEYAQALRQMKAQRSPAAGLSSLQPAVFTNNEAIVQLYNGQAGQALNELYEYCGQGPLQEALAVNLSTVSDLVSTNSQTLKQNYLVKQGQQSERSSSSNEPLFEAQQLMRIG